MRKIVKVAYCSWCGNENLVELGDDKIYCNNCNENIREQEIGYRNMLDSETVVSSDYIKQLQKELENKKSRR